MAPKASTTDTPRATPIIIHVLSVGSCAGPLVVVALAVVEVVEALVVVVVV